MNIHQRLEFLETIKVRLNAYVKLFDCCEHEDSCFGNYSDLYSPWKCLKKDPFYSCNRVLSECLDPNADDRLG